MMLESPVRGKRARRVWRGPVRKRSSNATFAGWLPYGEAVAIIGSRRQKVQFFLMRLCYSRRGFAMAFPSQAQECFLAGHLQAFKHFGGIPGDHSKVGANSLLGLQ
jgi:transposase